MTEDNIIFTGNRKTRRALKRENNKKAKRGRLENRRVDLIPKSIPYDINYISFTGTLKSFHRFNAGQRYSNFKLPVRESDIQKWAVLNIGAFFSPNAHFFFGCKSEHLELNSFSKYNRHRFFRENFRVPYELSRLGHPDLSPVPPNHKLTFKALPPDLAEVWTIFASAIIQAKRDNRVYFYDDPADPWWHYIVKITDRLEERLRKPVPRERAHRFIDRGKQTEDYHSLERLILEINRNCCVVSEGKPVFGSDQVWDDFEHSYQKITKRRWAKKDLRNSMFRKYGNLAAKEIYGKDWVSPLKKMRRDELRIMKLKAVQENHIGYAKHKFNKI